MKFQLIGQTSFAWAELVKELPPEHIVVLQKSRINIQSANAFVRLMAAFDQPDADISKLECVQPYILDLWQWTFWFDLPYELIEEVLSKCRVHALNVPNPRANTNRGMLVGSLRDWQDLVLLGGKPFVSDVFTKLTFLVRGYFDRENLNFLLDKV
jgi:hypothetical protein